MSLSQYGYSTVYSSPSPTLTTSQLLPSSASTPSSSASPPSMSSGPCCENGTPLTHPHTGHTICSCQYPTTGMLPYPRLSLPPDPPPPTASGYPSIPGYGAAPPSQNYVPLPPESGPGLYPSLNSSYDLKEPGDSWRGVGPTPGCYPYDPTSIPSYPYPNTYGGVDINSAARRKNATRENTNTLKAWLYEHRKNPYPTKGEKIMLAIITKMTLTQVSTWFANARRRLKKENKMTWSPRNKPGENDDDENDDDKEKNDQEDSDDDNKGSVVTSNDGRDSQSSVDISAPDCSGARGHPVTTQLFDPPHHDPISSSLGSHYGGYDVTTNGAFGGLGASQQQQQQQHLNDMIPSRSLNNYGAPHNPHLSYPQNNSNNNNNDNGNHNVPQSHLSYHQLPPADVEAMSPYPQHLSSQKSASLGYAHSPASQNIHNNSSNNNNNNNTLEGIPQMPIKIEPSSATPSMTRPDSLCSSSNDSGLHDVPNNMAGYHGAPGGNGNPAIMEGMRPKIWSLANEATSDAGYNITHGAGIPASPGSNNGNLLNNNKLTGYNNNNNIMAPNHNIYHNGSVHESSIQPQHHHHHHHHQQQRLPPHQHQLNNYDPPSQHDHHQQSMCDESIMTQQQHEQQQQQRSALAMTSADLDRFQNNNATTLDQHHEQQQQQHHLQDSANPRPPLEYNSPPPSNPAAHSHHQPSHDPHPHHHSTSSSPLSASSSSSPLSSVFPTTSSSSSSNTLSSLLPPAPHDQWSTTPMYSHTHSNHGYYPPYNSSPLHPAPQYHQIGPPPPPFPSLPHSSLQSTSSIPQPPPPPPAPQSHIPLIHSPHLPPHPSVPYRGTPNIPPYPHSANISSGNEGVCEGGTMPSSPSSQSSPSMTASTFNSNSSTSSSVPSQ